MKQSYARSEEDVLEQCQATVEGLTIDEVKKRQEKYGKNEMKTKPKKTIFEMVLEQLKDKMILILLAASILSFFLQEYVESVVILIIIAINTIVSIIQEKKAADAIEALKQMNAPHASVLRDGIRKTILVSDLVVGDIVYLEDGGIVPADIRLLEEHHLMIDESSLTGESVPVEKNASLILDEETTLADQVNMAFSSSIITYGTGLGVVVAIGMDTEVGKIARMLDSEDDLETPLKKKLNSVGQVLSIVGILISILIFIIGFLYGKDVVTLLMISISLAISVIPEGLPATATIVMALGVQRMAKKNALVKKLPAVETLGSASVICSDKTGTLTQNKMTVTRVLLYDELLNDSKEEIPTEIPEDFMYACMLCNNATLNGEEQTGDPTEVALLAFANERGYNSTQIKKEYTKLYEQPFDSDRKRMSIICKKDGKFVCYTKGAAEEMLDLCTHIVVGNEEKELTYSEKEKILEECSKLSNEALRLLGIAKRTVSNLPESDDDDIEQHLTFIGLVGMIDPPREEVMKAIETCHTAGIRVIMITGDHKLTAISIAKKLGIFRPGDEAMTGEELHRISDKELKKRIPKISIFARVTPEDKLRIVNALKANKEVVAMTGDGVNDSPALKAADIGIAMGKVGTDVAKSAADMLLLDDNFTTIEVAIREGRRVYRNIQKVIQYLLAGNIAEVLTIFVAMVLNLQTPILAVHILFVNLVTDTLPALALGVDPEGKNVMRHKPVKTGSLFEKGLVYRVVFYGLYIAILSLTAYHIGLEDSYETAITMTFLVLCLSQIVHALNQHSSTVSIFSKEHPKNKYLYGAMILSTLFLLPIIFISPIAKFFSIVPLTSREWMIVGGLSVSPLIVVEFVKWIRRKMKKI